MIVDELGARRLAQAIWKDVVLYGGGEAALDDPGKQAEARGLFLSRVSGSLAHVLEEERTMRRGGRPMPDGPAPHAAVRPRGESGSPMAPIIIAVALLVLALGVSVMFSLR